MELTQAAARGLMVTSLGLGERPQQPAAKADVLSAIRRMGALQIDTINVVARSPYLVLFARLGRYDPRWLDELLAEGEVFEYWAHEASFLPREDYPLFRRLQLDRGDWMRHWIGEHPDVTARVLEHVRERGVTRSADFVRTDGKGGGWWSWKPEKRVLEALFATGDLMVARRQSFQRVYDLRERVRPDWSDEGAPTAEDVQRTLALRAVRCLGVTTARWVPDYFRMRDKADVPALLERLVAEGELRSVSVEGWPAPAYVHVDNWALAERAAAGELHPSLTTLLSPFDPLVWHRGRVREAYGFDFKIECYTPAPQRKYGYFLLPILHRGALVGRLDAKAHRKEGRFEVRALYLEPGVEPTAALAEAVGRSIAECASWHETPEVEIVRSELPGLEGAYDE